MLVENLITSTVEYAFRRQAVLLNNELFSPLQQYVMLHDMVAAHSIVRVSVCRGNQGKFHRWPGKLNLNCSCSVSVKWVCICSFFDQLEMLAFLSKIAWEKKFKVEFR